MEAIKIQIVKQVVIVQECPEGKSLYHLMRSDLLHNNLKLSKKKKNLNNQTEKY
jgi:hypothetical protein